MIKTYRIKYGECTECNDWLDCELERELEREQSKLLNMRHFEF